MPGPTATRSSNSPGPAAGDSSTRDVILDSAARLIVEEGFAACTMRAISQRVQIKAGSLYYHFASKDDIVFEIMNLGAAMLHDAVIAADAALPPDAPFAERIATAVRAHVLCKSDRTQPFMQVYEYLPTAVKRQSREMRHRYAGFWIAFLEAGKRSGEVRPDLDAQVFVPFFLSALNRLPEWVRPGPRPLDEIIAMICATMLDGIRAPSRG